MEIANQLGNDAQCAIVDLKKKSPHDSSSVREHNQGAINQCFYSTFLTR
jgi:hypothetical protein